MGGRILLRYGWKFVKVSEEHLLAPPPWFSFRGGASQASIPPNPLHHLFLVPKCELFLFHLPFSSAFVLPTWGPLISWTRKTRKRELKSPEILLPFKVGFFAMNIPCISTTGLLGGSWWDGDWKRVQMGKLGTPLDDWDEGHPDGPERKVGAMSRIPGFK